MSHRNVAVVVDGYNFALHTRWSIRYLDELLDGLREAVGDGKDMDVRFPTLPHSLHFFIPNPTDAMEKKLISQEQMVQTSQYLLAMERKGWKVHQTEFKRENGVWKASREDLEMHRLCAKLVTPDHFEPIGGDRSRITVTDLVLVTSDKDHIVTLRDASIYANNVLCWCVIPSSQPIAKEIADWGQGTQRLLQIHTPGPRMSNAPASPASSGTASPAVSAPSTPSKGRRDELCPSLATCGSFGCPYTHRSIVLTPQFVTIQSNFLLPTKGKTSCLTDNRTTMGACYLYMAKGNCRYGNNCEFLHPAPNAPMQKDDEAKRIAEERKRRDDQARHSIVMCEVCADSYSRNDQTVSGVNCASQHFCCSSCLTQHIQKWTPPSSHDGVRPVLRCPTSRCRAPLEDLHAVIEACETKETKNKLKNGILGPGAGWHLIPGKVKKHQPPTAQQKKQPAVECYNRNDALHGHQPPPGGSVNRQKAETSGKHNRKQFQCWHCEERQFASKGVRCSSSEKRHFTCGVCFSNYVLNVWGDLDGDFTKLSCMFEDCGCAITATLAVDAMTKAARERYQSKFSLTHSSGTALAALNPAQQKQMAKHDCYYCGDEFTDEGTSCPKHHPICRGCFSSYVIHMWDPVDTHSEVLCLYEGCNEYIPHGKARMGMTEEAVETFEEKIASYLPVEVAEEEEEEQVDEEDHFVPPLKKKAAPTGLDPKKVARKGHHADPCSPSAAAAPAAFPSHSHAAEAMAEDKVVCDLCQDAFETSEGRPRICPQGCALCSGCLSNYVINFWAPDAQAYLFPSQGSTSSSAIPETIARKPPPFCCLLCDSTLPFETVIREISSEARRSYNMAKSGEGSRHEEALLAPVTECVATPIEEEEEVAEPAVTKKKKETSPRKKKPAAPLPAQPKQPAKKGNQKKKKTSAPTPKKTDPEEVPCWECQGAIPEGEAVVCQADETHRLCEVCFSTFICTTWADDESRTTLWCPCDECDGGTFDVETTVGQMSEGAIETYFARMAAAGGEDQLPDHQGDATELCPTAEDDDFESLQPRAKKAPPPAVPVPVVGKKLPDHDDDVPMPDNVATLMEMGFSEQKAIAALRQSHNDTDAALDLLFSGVIDEVPDQPPQATACSVLRHDLD